MPIKHRPKHLLWDNSIYFLTASTYAHLPHLLKEGAKKSFSNILFEKIHKFTYQLDAWVILNNHYHLILRVGDSGFLSRFVSELHGASSFEIKKLPLVKFTDKEQVGLRKRTPMEERVEKRLDKIVRELERGLKAATSEIDRSSDVHVAPNNKRSSDVHVAPDKRALKGATPVHKSELATFTSRLNSEQREQLFNAIALRDFDLAKVLLCTYCPSEFDIPFWYQYTDYIIRNEEDYYKHLNYLHQNPVKHSLVNKVTDWEYSSYGNWLEEKGSGWMANMLAEYPVADFDAVWLE